MIAFTVKSTVPTKISLFQTGSLSSNEMMLHWNNDDSIVPVVISNQLFMLEYRLNGIETSTDTIRQAHGAILYSLKQFLIKKFNLNISSAVWEDHM